ncbi:MULTISPECIES: spore coat U domain-containing protein [Acinetobacter]|uniref:Csu type fimbrial protein n=1 Tax=Acinetobacter TaxID=469 RepID=UPI00158DAA1D|nr:spore coat U domain-containing protein [Acinetobacter sp. FDAARGOS_724]QKW82279.1 spore coat protein U domain-containing protein [Acinetobacter sp. FDAARGOS_724]
MVLEVKQFFYSITALALLYVPALTFADCNVSSSGVSFGNYDVFTANANESTGELIVTCSVETAYTLQLDPGRSGNFIQRNMLNGTEPLAYNIYSDGAKNLVWGDGTGGSVTKNGQTGATKETHTLYGRIPARQNVLAGNYSDTIIVTIVF